MDIGSQSMSNAEFKTWVDRIYLKYREEVISGRASALLPLIAELVADAILYGSRRSLSHEGDPEWDCSGSLVAHPEGPEFSLKDYTKLGDFLDEYTGESMPNLISGCGTHHLTYKDQVDSLFSDYLQTCREGWFETIREEEILKFQKYLKNSIFTIENLSSSKILKNGFRN
jgi:hypothetical protein